MKANFKTAIPPHNSKIYVLNRCQKEPEMGDKKKKTFMFIRLVSAAGTGFFYVKRKSAKKVAEKLEFRKYDPRHT
ncbi:54S ribosomal protein L39, mitochondrial [Gossypium australe]|uniref:Large ribosomal subunit protein bL33c n=1 Tax=Gossypium australe TaxID=47621 RepID=A0A5B6U8X5_9ROSI|nr:54S ribosomal protein L39, mitochondrial [Gossypium australe]